MGSCLGGDPMPKELENLRLEFGELKVRGETGEEKESGNNMARVRQAAMGSCCQFTEGGGTRSAV